ncbi:uncharacterized protein CELE_F49D11.14 [Caenorhabditis elegans]|uniref:Transmembrane protein n=1 Tax=Caenorhabditis elegans TaxID=6239 RepID=S6EZN0_CAEEL|nr:Transmembrane protein [Caenorhabditis elegans]CDG24103.1 Transmembrane protein [Caenorhabditis elegans]|eukprot:NP_001293278.1 Uncharacterized protein CELE_F49D11.14 [Caenorhabditis elegans]
MDKYQVSHYFKHYQTDTSELYWSYIGLAVIFVVSASIPLWLQYRAVGDVTNGDVACETPVQWHLEQEIAKIKTDARRKKGKKKRGSLSTEEN